MRLRLAGVHLERPAPAGGYNDSEGCVVGGTAVLPVYGFAGGDNSRHNARAVLEPAFEYDALPVFVDLDGGSVGCRAGHAAVRLQQCLHVSEGVHVVVQHHQAVPAAARVVSNSNASVACRALAARVLSCIFVVSCQPCRSAGASNEGVNDEIDDGTEGRGPAGEVGLWDVGERVEGNTAVVAAQGVRRARVWRRCMRAYAQNPSFFHASRSPQSQQPPALVLYLRQQSSQL